MASRKIDKAARLDTLCQEIGKLLDASTDSCVVAWDASDRPEVLYACGPVRVVFQKDVEELVGSPAGLLFVGGERAARDLAQAAIAAPVSELRSLLRGGRPFAAQVLARGAEGAAIAIIRDLTLGQAATDAALRSDDLARFASLIAHEVRNPLSAVKIALQTLERHGSLGSNDLRRVAIALREVLNIELLLNEVLEFARPPSLALVPGDPRPAVQDAVSGVEAEWAGRNVTFSLKLPDRMPPLQLDPQRMRTCAKILCRQAAVAAEERGGGTIEVSLEATDGGCTLRVTDPGHTLPPEIRDKAFIPFTPNRARGSGLGLAVVARIAREHGGTARLDARESGGNVISVTFAG